MADKKISELDQTLLLDNDADFPLSQDNAGEPTTFRAKLTQLATKIAEDITFSNLQTTSKKLVGAINELLSLGSPIIIGTTAPTSSIGADGNIYVQYTAGTGGADDEVDGIYVKIDGAWCEISTGGGSGTTDYEDLSNKPQVNSIELVGNKSLDDLGIMPASLSKTVSGAIAHFTDGAENIPVKSLVSQIVAVESGSGEKSPDNPYTISGFDNGVVPVCGVNLWDEDYELGFWNASGVFSPNTSGYMSSITHIPVKPNTSICVVIPNNISFYLCRYDKDKNFIDRLTLANPSQRVVQMTSETYYITFSTYQAYGTTYNHDISINYPSSDTQYHAYNGNNYTFAFGQTVYGGHLNVTTGEVESELDLITYDGSENWQKNGEYFYIAVPSANQTSFTVISNQYQGIAPTNYNAIPNGYMALASGGYNYLNIHDNSYATLEDFKTALSNTNLQVLYKKVTPTTIQLTPTEVPTLLGENNIFSNCGDVEVNYYTDNADEIAEVAKATASKPLHNYSTDEQVIGTWIDGSTVYEKTLLTPSAVTISASGSWISSGVSAPSGSTVIEANIVYLYVTGVVGIYVNNETQAIYLSNIPKVADITIPANTPITIRYTKSSS